MGAALRLAALLFLLALTTSRVGLLLHELAGHGGVAAAFGCRLTGLRLFLFGGGYVDYQCPPLARASDLVIDLGGIALELVLGALALAFARRRAGPLALAVSFAGALFVLHALFYLVTGVHYGVGDGRALRGLLGAGRGALVLAGSLALVAGSFATAAGVGRRLAGSLAALRFGARVAALAGAALAAGLLHGALMQGEQRLLRDARYAATFQPEHEREIAAQLRGFEQQRPRTPAEIAAKRHALERREAPFPLEPWLGAGMAAAALAGIVVACRGRASAAPAAPALGPIAGACGLALALVYAADRLL